MKGFYNGFLFLFIFSFISISVAQDKAQIKNNEKYYCGEGVAETEQEASSAALNELTKGISVMVESEFLNKSIETTNGLNQTVNSILNTYATATLKNVKTIATLMDGKFDVFHYIEKSEVQKIFAEREKLITDIFQRAKQYEESLNYGDALKWYYFSIILINSLPETNLNHDGLNLVTEIPSRISTILTNVKFKLKTDRKISDKERELTFTIQANGKPVQKIDLSCWSGSGWINISAIDGEGVISWFGGSADMDKLNISIKYSYYESREEIKAVSELWGLVKKPSFNITKEINLRNVEVVKKDSVKVVAAPVATPAPANVVAAAPAPTNAQAVTQVATPAIAEDKVTKGTSKILNVEKGSYKLNITDADSCNVLTKIGQETLTFLELVGKGNVQKMKDYYSYDSFLKNKIANLISFNKPVVVGDIIEAKINKTLAGWELRKIKVLNRYATIKKQSSEYLILDFDKDGNFNDLSYGVLDAVYNNVEEIAKNYGNDWINRQTILKFVEKYRTAFLTRDMGTIDSMFADEAVIIVGRVIKKTNIKDAYKYLPMNEGQPDARYMRYTKNEYLKNLTKLFNETDDIFIGYSTFDIKKKNNDESGRPQSVYGISMRQNYHSTNYADEGYLFLLIDFNSKLPQIYVRGWQPNEWDDSSMIKLANFNINR